MRIYDDRYSRERLRFHVALRFIRLEARTHTIRLWTGLTDDRIRKLYRSYLADGTGRSPARHRGKSPQRAALLLRSARIRQESALLASLCQLLGALPERLQAGAALRLPAPGRGELLCQAYEVYRGLIAEPALAFEHAVLLLSALTHGEELVCGACRDCGALLVLDRWVLHPPRCALCAAAVEQAAAARQPPPPAASHLPAMQPVCKTGLDGSHPERRSASADRPAAPR